jgi:hypothetical protein
MTAIDRRWRVIVIGGHTRSIGKTQLVCDVIGSFPEANWIAGKITQYGHGFCVKKGKHCDCAPEEHICAINWENGSSPRSDSGRFLTAGAKRSFWLRTKQGYLAEGIPLLRAALHKCEADTGAHKFNTREQHASRFCDALAVPDGFGPREGRLQELRSPAAGSRISIGMAGLVHFCR